METHQEKSSEVIIPILQNVKLHFGTVRISVLKSMIKHPNQSAGDFAPSWSEDVDSLSAHLF